MQTGVEGTHWPCGLTGSLVHWGTGLRVMRRDDSSLALIRFDMMDDMLLYGTPRAMNYF